MAWLYHINARRAAAKEKSLGRTARRKALTSWPKETKWRCLINKGASQFEAKRICEAERKRKERKARAKGPSSDSAQSEFTCSICNRQFRAKIGLYSHQRTHINALYSGIKMVFLSNESRTITVYTYS